MLNKNTILVFTILFIMFSFGTIIANAEENSAEISPTKQTVQTVQKIDAQKVEASPETSNVRGQQIETKSDIEAKRVKTYNSSDDVKNKRIENRDKIKTTETRVQKLSNDAKEQRAETKINIQERKEQKAENREIKKTERIERLNEKAKERITKYADRTINRLNAAINRILKLADRVEARIIKLEERFRDKGLDLSEAKKLVEKARKEAGDAQSEINSISEIFIETIDAENPKESFSKAREHIKNAILSIKNAHKTLVEAIKLVKASVAKDTTDTEIDDNNI